MLLRLIASLDRPSAGRIAIYGYDTVRRARAVRDRIGYVPEEPMLYDGLSAEQYLQFVGRARGLGKQVRQVAVDTLLQVVGLEERRWRDVSALSPGERRRLALASALVHEPDVLLLDDPLRGLDGFARLEQIEVLRELHRLGSTMVVSATRPEDLLEVCDTFAVLRDGDAGMDAAMPTRRRRSPRRSTLTPCAYAPSSSTGSRPALTLLGQRRDVRELEVDEDGRDRVVPVHGRPGSPGESAAAADPCRLQRRPLRRRAPLASRGHRQAVPRRGAHDDARHHTPLVRRLTIARIRATAPCGEAQSPMVALGAGRSLTLTSDASRRCR